jgi:hypothetical protein
VAAVHPPIPTNTSTAYMKSFPVALACLLLPMLASCYNVQAFSDPSCRPDTLLTDLTLAIGPDAVAIPMSQGIKFKLTDEVSTAMQVEHTGIPCADVEPAWTGTSRTRPVTSPRPQPLRRSGSRPTALETIASVLTRRPRSSPARYSTGLTSACRPYINGFTIWTS